MISVTSGLGESAVAGEATGLSSARSARFPGHWGLKSEGSSLVGGESDDASPGGPGIADGGISYGPRYA